MTETIPAMKARHNREIRNAIEAQALSGVTQTVAAKRLGMTLQGLNNFVQRKGINWPVKEPGHRTDIHTPETTQ
jgi:hypothetical protein